MLQLPCRWTQLIYLCAFSFTVCSFTHFGSSATFPRSPVYLSNTEYSAVVITFIFSAKNISSKSSRLSGIHQDEYLVPLPVLLQRWSLSERTERYKTEWSTLERKFRDSVSVFITTSDQLNESRSDSNYGITSDSCLPTAQDIEFLFFFYRNKTGFETEGWTHFFRNDVERK